MVLHVDSDAAYLVAPGAKSRVADFCYFKEALDNYILPQLSNLIHVESKYLRYIVSSAAEAEVSGIFHNFQTAIPLQNTLILMVHPQPSTPVKTDNTTAKNFAYSNITVRKAKTWDMRYY